MVSKIEGLEEKYTNTSIEGKEKKYIDIGKVVRQRQKKELKEEPVRSRSKNKHTKVVIEEEGEEGEEEEEKQPVEKADQEK